MKNINLAFFTQAALKTKKSYQDAVNQADQVISQCRILLSATKDEDLQKNLNEIIKKTTEVLTAIKFSNNQKNSGDLCCELTQLALALPEKLPSKNNLGSMSTTIANIALFLLAASVAIYLGYLFYAAYYAYTLERIAESFIWTCATDFIPFSLTGLFANYVSKTFSEKAITIEELQTSINSFCSGEVELAEPTAMTAAHA